ncbi:inner membrane protein [Melghirimyces profundicolus]|uniref:Inner membrane protein n=1 Tax=Melghirimyces profundicolus TaxID=1242148 RepID=A0A2T6AZB3_9BACL|nr:metal-dependent hydrolase [Melghirimyces profundicolus]PTX49157.1 inner membrane protein [Melghirimyces profundicolus]
MDNLTHGLLGYAVYAATRKEEESRKEQLGYAAAAVIGGEIPDIEGFTTFMGPEIYLTWHRAFTHSVLFAPVLALLAVGTVALFNRAVRRKKAYVLALAAILIHIAADWANTWGTGLLEPIIRERYSLGILPIVDVIILSIFAVAFALKRKYGTARVFKGAWAAMLLYVSFQAVHAGWLESRLDHRYETVTASARMMPSQFHLVAKTEDGYHFYDGSAFTGLRKTGEAKNERHPVVKEALKDGEARALVRFLPDYGTEVEELEDVWRVTIYDPRFRQQNSSLLSTEVVVPKRKDSQGG